MKKVIIAITLGTAILVLSACNNTVSGNEEILASTKVGDITKDELYEEMKEAIGDQVFENLVLKKAIENEFKVSDKELEEAISKQKVQYGDEKSFELYLAQKNITNEFFEKQIEFSLLQKKLIESLDEVTEEQIKAEYEKMKKEIHAHHILVEDKKTAEEVIAKLKDGEDFAELAKEYSTEPIAQQSGGDLGWFSPGKMVQPFDDVAFALPENEISEPVQTSFGYHVIKVSESREKELEETFEELQPEIEDKLKESLFNKKLITLLNEANIDIKDEAFKNALDAYLLDVKE